MGFNFITADRDQPFLLPPDMREWLPADHLVWFVVDVVEQVDLGAFRRSYRDDGHGRAAYDPAILVAVLLYAYCTGVRSSRTIERRCLNEISYRVLAAGLTPDHVTIARFRARHADALAGIFVDSLRLCAEAGLVKLGAVALDGTKIGANAALEANRTLEALQRQIAGIIAEAEAIDAAETAQAAAAAADVAEVGAAAKDAPERSSGPGGSGGLQDPVQRRVKLQAARGRLEAAQARLQAQAAQREQRFARRSEQVNAARAVKGLPLRELRPRPWDEAPRPGATTNLTDPDSRVMRGRHGKLQGYNAQAITTAEQIIVAAELTQSASDVDQLHPMLSAAAASLHRAGVSDRIAAVAADAGYWRNANVDGSQINQHPPQPKAPATAAREAPELFIVVARHGRRGRPRQDGGPAREAQPHLVTAMQAKLRTDTGRAMMRMRHCSVEPVFGQIKDTRGIRHFTRRGLSAAAAEWQLIAATHNLLKLHRARLATA